MKKPPPGKARALRDGVVFAAGAFQIAPSAPEFQKNHIQRRFGLPPATAAVIAELALASAPESWRASR